MRGGSHRQMFKANVVSFAHKEFRFIYRKDLNWRLGSILQHSRAPTYRRRSPVCKQSFGNHEQFVWCRPPTLYSMAPAEKLASQTYQRNISETYSTLCCIVQTRLGHLLADTIVRLGHTGTPVSQYDTLQFRCQSTLPELCYNPQQYQKTFW